MIIATRTRAVADVLAIAAENEALRAALDAERAEKRKWFDIALERLGMIQKLSHELSVARMNDQQRGSHEATHE